ncbi:NAD(P)-binding domain-containing protein [Bradyrhizobium sp. 143]|nr:NAD(P)-binding domain-containing protein [Bradyrhizobium sp. 143]MCK1726741.1 NAD(P)-binding domain-containing protein [Bradyrhizobium sp. 142]
MDVGFIGLGAMGSAMARRLIGFGHHVLAWNRSPGPADSIVQAGGIRVATPRDALSAPVAITMLADDSTVRSVLLELRAARKWRVARFFSRRHCAWPRRVRLGRSGHRVGATSESRPWRLTTSIQGTGSLSVFWRRPQMFA